MPDSIRYRGYTIWTEQNESGRWICWVESDSSVQTVGAYSTEEEAVEAGKDYIRYQA